MQLSRFFLPTLKESPAEAQIISHQLMLRAGMIRQLTSGIYTWLPLGLTVLRKVEQIIREEMNRAGCHEVLMSCNQPAELWQRSGRYEAYGKELLRYKDRHDRELLFGPTNEEVITEVFAAYIKSYRDLPQHLYQIQWKFRDEIRPRFGVMRGREFLMKDNYSFDLTPEDARKSYFLMYETYLRTFQRMGLTAVPVQAVTGAIGGTLSHEFQIVAETGESTLYYDKRLDAVREGTLSLSIEEIQQLYAAADEQHDPATCPLAEADLRVARGIEVGHIFYFGTKYSEPLGASVTHPDGELRPVEMGSYGIGVSRLVGAIIEAYHDANGICWPEEVAPFKVAILNLKQGDAACDAAAGALYQQLQERGVEVLYDDTEARAGEKFARMDLIGVPWQIILGPKGVAAGVVELKHRRSGERQELSVEAALAKVVG
jgi:prolyl-tRNA synthetase